MTGQSKHQPPITNDLAQRIKDELGENVYLCYQCVKCTSGCPVGEFFDWQPNQIMRAVQLGQDDIALNAETPWLCAACQTCTTRCPQGLDIAAIMEFLTRESVEQGIKSPNPQVEAFNKAFMREVRIWGRSYEPGLMAEYKLRTMRKGGLLDDMDLYLKMLKKGKVAFIPKRATPPRNVKPVPGAATSIAYYPGCSLHSTATEYDKSTRAVCEALEINLVEPKGWQCCGGTAAHRTDPEAAFRLPIENLSVIEQSGFGEVTMPCAACFNRHKAAQYEARQDEHHAIPDDYPYQGTVRVSTLSDAILRHAGVEGVQARVERPLDGLRVVCYYGCLLTRPPDVTGATHPENPTEMDSLMTALGMEVHDWSYKTSCCGATHSLTRPDIVRDLSSNLIARAREAGADALVVACPLCHTNLDGRQFQMKLKETTPVFYFTQLMALALGLPEKAAALNKNLVDPRPLLQSKGILER